MPDNDPLLTSPQVGRALGMSARSVHRLAESGRLPAAHKLPGVNGSYLFRESDVRRFMTGETAA